MPDTTGWVRASALSLPPKPMPHPYANLGSPAMQHVARGLARAFICETDDPLELRRRGIAALGQTQTWLPRMVRRLEQHFGLPLNGQRFDEIVAHILIQPSFIAAFERRPNPRLYRYFSLTPRMRDLPRALAKLDLPKLHTLGDLAAWLGLSIDELDWLADVKSMARRTSKEALQHYQYQWKLKASGGYRLIESPKPLLCQIQRKILHGLLDKIPVHEAAHGCVPGRSILSHAQPHIGSAIILKMDLQDFFTSIRAARVQALFRTLGYPTEVARTLTALCTHLTPSHVLRHPAKIMDLNAKNIQTHRDASEAYRIRHLPQGAPSSAAIANLCAWRLDIRMNGAAQECGARYTRYVDDLVFSCPTHTRAHANRIALMLNTIIVEEGFRPNRHKTHLLSQAQAQWITGILINEKPNISRPAFDRLKAILTNCIRHGPESQNREDHPNFRAHLHGCIAHVKHIHPERGERLTALFRQIKWSIKES